MSKVSMKGVIDMHVHTNPDLRLRAYDDFEMMEAGIRVGARAIVLKTHQGTTMDRAYLCNRHNEIVHGKTNNFTMFGSITLNKVVGGINPKAVDVALSWERRSMKLPTQSARNHMVKNNLDPAGCVDVVRDGKVVPELNDVFGLIRDHNAVLGTAHVSPEEAFIVVEAARNAGVKNIVVTHPEWWIVDMSVEDQVRIVKDYDVILERCYAQNMGGGKYKEQPSVQRGDHQRGGLPERDGGHRRRPDGKSPLGAGHGGVHAVSGGSRIPEEHVYHMTRTIPSRLLGLED